MSDLTKQDVVLHAATIDESLAKVIDAFMKANPSSWHEMLAIQGAMNLVLADATNKLLQQRRRAA